MRVISPSRKLFLKISAIIAGLLLLLAALLTVISFAYGDKVKELVVREINSRLMVPVEVAQVDFTLFRNFPDASVVFRNVAMKPSPDLTEAPGLLHAKSVSLRIGLSGILTGNYKIRSLIIDEASATLWVGKNGLDNFHIWKLTPDVSGSAVKFDVQQVILRKSAVYYRNLIRKTDLAFGLPEFQLKGKMADQRYDLQVSGDVEIKRLILGEYNYTPKSLLGITGIIRVNEALRRCEITHTNLKFAGISAGIHGSFGYGNNDNPVNLSINASEADVSEVLGALPASLSGPYNDYDPAGKLTLQAEIGGNWGKRSSPVIRTTFDLSDGSFTHRESGSRIRNIVLSGKYTSSQVKTPEVLRLESFSGETRNGRFKGMLQLADFKNPVLNLNLSADIDLSELEGILKAAEARDYHGRLVADIKYRGAYSAGAKMAVTANGLIRLSGVGFTSKTSEVRASGITGQFELKNGRIFIDELRGVIGDTDLKMNGFVDNLIGYILFEGQPIHFEAQINSGNFRLEDFLDFSVATTDTVGHQSIFAEGLSFKTSFSVSKFSYKKFTASAATGSLSLTDNVLRATGLAFNALDGSVSATGLMNDRYGSHAQIVCDARLTNVDISRMFYEFNDFGQTSLQSRHLKGRGDATVQYASTINKHFETDEGSVTAVADVEIRSGELNRFEPFQEMSRFLDEEELENVKFSTLRNRIEIARKTVVIPEMEIQTSALNVKGYGSHTFGNEIDYHFSVLTSELRKNKRRKTMPPPTAVEDDGLGRTRLFLHMTGTVDEPVFSYDHRAVAKKIATDFKQEKQVFRDVLRKEFGKNKSGEEEVKTKSSTQFEIEWDEDK
ncbi:MAG: AsmA-like C-terminal region-containing protein [Bacteroidota bacterium]